MNKKVNKDLNVIAFNSTLIASILGKIAIKLNAVTEEELIEEVTKTYEVFKDE